MKFFLSLLLIIPVVWVLVSLFDPSSPTVGRLAPAFTLKLIEGQELSLKDLRGKVVLLNFWASGCSPCRAEASDLEFAWKAYRDRDVHFLGINIKNDKAGTARKFLKDFGITFPNGWDDGKTAHRYSVVEIPRTFIIDPNGRITYMHMGSIKSAIIRVKLDEARNGVITSREGKGEYQLIRAVSKEDLDNISEGTRKEEKELLPKSPVKDKYTRINVHSVENYKGQWVKILLKNGLKREGKIVEVKEDVIQLQQSFTAGSFSIRVPIQQIEEIHLLDS